MAGRWPRKRGRPVAEVSAKGPARPFRLMSTRATAHPDDTPLVIEADHEPSQPARTHVGRIDGPDHDGRTRVEVVVDGWRFEFVVEDDARATLRERASRERASGDATGGPLEIRAIIPGRVVAVAVVVGDVVEAGQKLLTVEAMKMQNELQAPRAGTVTRLPASVGDTVELGDVLVVLA